jgi:prevent-host-death family protein
MPTSTRASGRTAKPRPDTWTLQDAKARLSDVLRRARTDGPQHVTVHGKPTAVVVSEEAFAKLECGLTGQALIDIMRASPCPELDLETASIRAPVRDVIL